ncbi:hypothetical protein ACFE04_006270 [Oxalis oulophora]
MASIRRASVPVYIEQLVPVRWRKFNNRIYETTVVKRPSIPERNSDNGFSVPAAGGGRKERPDEEGGSQCPSTKELSFQYGGSKNFLLTPQRSDSIPKESLPTTNIPKDIGSSSTSNKAHNKFFETSDEEDDEEIILLDDFVAMLQYSPTLYDDFRS